MSSATSTDSGSGTDLAPWQFFVLGALGCATIATFLARGRGFVVVVLLAALMAAAALVGMAALRAFRPLVSNEEDRTAMVGRRTRAALEREKMLSLRAIKELEFDRAMGRLSDADWHEMSSRLRARAARLIQQLDAGGDYREQIERDVAKRLAERESAVRPSTVPAKSSRECAACATVNDEDARFCKSCGQKL